MVEESAGNLCLALDGKKLVVANFNAWLGKVRGVFRHFLIAPANNSKTIFSAFIVHVQRKTKDAKRHIKDEFYFNNVANRSNIPKRTWKRHGAFLHYRQQQLQQHVRQQQAKAVCRERMTGLQVGRVQQAESISEIPTAHPVDDKRMIFRVKSIKLSPIWATALSDLYLFEDDLSSLRFMANHLPINNIARAA